MKNTSLLLSAIALTLSACATHADPPISARSAWTDKTPDTTKAIKQADKIRLITIHQTETPENASTTLEAEKKRLRSIRTGHTTGTSQYPGKGWSDIAYHYIIGPSGTIYSCRDTQFQSDSATVIPEDLKGNITVCLMGDFRTQQEKGSGASPDSMPTPQALESLRLLLTKLLNENGLTTADVKAHRDLRMSAGGSDCPGGLFYPMIAEKILPAVNSGTPIKK